MKERKYYTVIYRTGGTENAQWHKIFERYYDKEQANEKKLELEKMGYKSLVHDGKLLELHGMPEGWNAKYGYKGE